MATKKKTSKTSSKKASTKKQTKSKKAVSSKKPAKAVLVKSKSANVSQIISTKQSTGSNAKSITTLIILAFLALMIFLFWQSQTGPNADSAKPTKNQFEDLNLKVEPGSGALPSSTSDYLQKSSELQNSKPENLNGKQQGLDYLQPNSGTETSE